MSANNFWVEYMEAVESGETRNDFAKRMGLTVQAVYSRVYDKQKMGYDLPHLKAANPKQSHGDFAELMKQHGIERKQKPANGKPAKTAKPKAKPQPAQEVVHEEEAEFPEDILDILG